MDDLSLLIEEYNESGMTPADCEEGCEVEIDGECEHGRPALLALKVGLMA